MIKFQLDTIDFSRFYKLLRIGLPIAAMYLGVGLPEQLELNQRKFKAEQVSYAQSFFLPQGFGLEKYNARLSEIYSDPKLNSFLGCLGDKEKVYRLGFSFVKGCIDQYEDSQKLPTKTQLNPKPEKRIDKKKMLEVLVNSLVENHSKPIKIDKRQYPNLDLG